MRVSRSDAQHKHRNSFGKYKPNSRNRYSQLNRWMTNTAPDPQQNHHRLPFDRFLHTNHRKPAFVHPEQNLQVGVNVVNRAQGKYLP